MPGPVLVMKAKQILNKLDLTQGVTYQFTGEDENRKASQIFIGRALIIAVLLILVVMVAQFNSIALPLIVISSVLMSVMGVIMGLIVHD